VKYLSLRLQSCAKVEISFEKKINGIDTFDKYSSVVRNRVGQVVSRNLADERKTNQRRGNGATERGGGPGCGYIVDFPKEGRKEESVARVAAGK
jgi:hypothetical protein